jgi:predicted adenine nucleotide alpha hydrolase (AANH) superfamily ATPase
MAIKIRKYSESSAWSSSGIKTNEVENALPQTVINNKPKLLLHICCAPDLSWPLHRLKNYFRLYLFWYNPNIHPKPEHDKRYAEFVRLFDLEWGDYEIVEDRYEPKEFFDAFVKYKDLIHPDLKDADRSTVLKKSGEMPEWSDRCNPCYLMRLEQAAKQAQKLGITYFTSTLLISPKKLADKLFQYGLQSQEQVTGTKFLRFDFAKKDGYKKAGELTKQYDLYRQNYCGCGWTIPKPGERREGYKGG